MIEAIALLFACSTPPDVATPAPATAAPPEHPHVSMSEHMASMDKTRGDLRTALGDAYDQPVPGLDGADPTRGKATYDATCAACHGLTGKGDGPAGEALATLPADFTDAFHARYYADAGRVYIIEHGIAGTGMPAWGGQIDHAALLDLYAYVRNFREQPAP